MVVKLEGSVNGDAVIFQKKQGDTWEAIVPSALDGAYIVDMTAYDEAGNETYWAKYILTVDLTSLCAHLTKHPYQSEILKSDYTADLIECDKNYYACIEDDLNAELNMENYYAELLKRRCDLDDVCRI